MRREGFGFSREVFREIREDAGLTNRPRRSPGRPVGVEMWDRICKLYGWPQTFVAGL